MVARWIRDVDSGLQKQRPSRIVVIVLVLVTLVSAVDYATGPEIAFSIFYLGPIALAAWYAGRNCGLGISLLSAMLWVIADVTSGQHYTFFANALWAAFVRFGFFVITCVLLSELKAKIKRLEELAVTDALTGLANSRAFYLRLTQESARSKRSNQPFTMAYLDVDDFKAVNDQYGHAMGDSLLRAIAHTIRMHTRQTDLVARPGGDEFAILFPDTGFREGQAALNNLRERLCDTIRHEDRDTSVSIGAVTFQAPSEDPVALVKVTDDLMYDVKRRGKDNLFHKRWVNGGLVD
jgi:diguanylate cyclase (GGDEF)-like protein